MDGGDAFVAGDAFGEDAALPIDAAVVVREDAFVFHPDTGWSCAMPDADHDGHLAVACGGDDCDDADPNRFPGNAEVCDSSNHDEDCDPSTFASRDADGDGHVDAACCNIDAAGAYHCGDDCDDAQPSIHVGAPETCDGLDDDCDGMIDEGCGMPPPRPIAPLSTATVTSRQPTLRWALTPGTDGARVEICADRACTRSIATIDAAGSSTVPTSELPPGVVFWRLRSRTGTTTSDAIGPTWQFTLRARSFTGGVDTSWGTTLDVNGDGYADLGVGAFGAERTYVYLGSPSGIGTSPSTTLTGPDAAGSFGWSVASAGDVNGDGYADVVVGAYTVAGSTGRAYVYLGGSRGLGTSPSTTLTGPDGWAGDFGYAVASAGDVNGDGYADVAVGAPLLLVPGGMGRTYVYLGGPAGIGTSPATTITGRDGASGNGWFGAALVGAGDVNRDGYSDLAVGAWAASRAYVYLGSSSGLGTTPATTLVGPDGSSFGLSVACGGDVNGDGYVDLVVGARGAFSNSGAAYLYLGNPTGVGASAATVLTGPAGPLQFGSAVAAAGDVNGDGFSDLVVGTGSVVTGGVPSSVDRAYLYLGAGGSSISTSAVVTLTGPDGAGGYFGDPLAGAGDLNGDGYADVVVGAEGVSTSAGRAYVYRGSAAGLGATPTTTLSGPDGANGHFGHCIAGSS